MSLFVSCAVVSHPKSSRSDCYTEHREDELTSLCTRANVPNKRLRRKQINPKIKKNLETARTKQPATQTTPAPGDCAASCRGSSSGQSAAIHCELCDPHHQGRSGTASE